MTTEKTVTLHYYIDRAAALTNGYVIAEAFANVPLTDAVMRALTPEARAFVAAKLETYPEVRVNLSGGPTASNAPYPQRAARLQPEEIPAFVESCMAHDAAVTAQREAELAAEAAHRDELAADAERERAVLAQALVAPVACVIGFLTDSALYGQSGAAYVARTGIRAWLASASADLAAYWDHHGDRMELGQAAIAGVERHVEAMRTDRKAQRTQWVDDMVTFWGTANDRERRAAGVLPRTDVDALVWAAVQAPAGNEDDWTCPRCGDAHTETDEAEGKPVSAAVWAAAQALAGALQADVLETLGLVVRRDIVLVTYDCPICEPSHRFELRLTLEHPATGWEGGRSRYYPLEEV